MFAVYRRVPRSLIGVLCLCCVFQLLGLSATAQTIRPLGDYRTVQATIHQIIAQDAGLTPAEQSAAVHSQIALVPVSVSSPQNGKRPWQINILPSAAPQPLAQVTWQNTSQGTTPIVRWQPNAWLTRQQQQAVNQATSRVADYFRGQIIRHRGALTRDLKVRLAKGAVGLAANYLAVKISRKLAYKIAGEVVTFTFDYLVK
jgi:hypothetical protein